MASDGRQHGMPPDERKRIGVAWLLLDEHDGRVRQEVCDLCDDLTEDPEGARTPEPRQPGVWLDRHRVERQRRAGCIQGLVDRVAKGEDEMVQLAALYARTGDQAGFESHLRELQAACVMIAPTSLQLLRAP